MRKHRKLKNFILESITWIAVILFFVMPDAIENTNSMLPVYVFYGCIAWFGLFSIANNFFRGCE